MVAGAQLLRASVMHRRLAPKQNSFRYRALYVRFALDTLDDGTLARLMPVDRAAFVSFHSNDHGHRDGGNLAAWAKAVLAAQGLVDKVDSVALVCIPRVLGYVFNPVSFWLCQDANGLLRAVICEVRNTFGESHSYVCAHADGGPIRGRDWIEAKKRFHVSPFLQRSGTYRFKFVVEEERMAVRIDHHNEDGELLLQTSVAGRLEPLSKAALHRALVRQPLLTFKVVWLIHWQALRLLAKGVRYISKPFQQAGRVTRS